MAAPERCRKRKVLIPVMEKVIDLASYRSGHKRARASVPAPETVPHYFCQRCDTDQFKLYASGAVHCASCGALIRNILVSAGPSSQGAGQ